MERICVGDLHGDLTLYQEIKDKFKGYKITLVGDLLDSFLYSRTEQRLLLEAVLNDIEDGTVECLLGNHEWSYLWRVMRCSGYSGAFDGSILPLKARMFRLMKPFIYDATYEDPILITHAGLSGPVLHGMAPEGEFDIEEVLQKELRDKETGLVYAIGRARGGSNSTGGIFWCDWFSEFKPVEGLRQIMGHTVVDEIRVSSNGLNYNIDCLQTSRQLLKISESGTIEIITF